MGGAVQKKKRRKGGEKQGTSENGPKEGENKAKSNEPTTQTPKELKSANSKRRQEKTHKAPEG